MGSLRKSTKIEKSIGSFLHPAVSCDFAKNAKWSKDLVDFMKFQEISTDGKATKINKNREIDQILSPLRIFRKSQDNPE